MVEAASIEGLRTALAPVEELRGGHSELEASVLESFAALEALHGELSEWQRELTRQQAELDQREAAVNDAECVAPDSQPTDVDRRIAEMRDESRQLEAENAEQLQAINDLDRQLVAAQAELRTVRKHSEELLAALETERERAVDEHRQWHGDLREMRSLLQAHSQMLVSLGAEPVADAGPDDEAASATDEPAPRDAEAMARVADLRRRASTRLAHRRPT
jgi:DNA repair exonuclease SbcCD ATPase subunit